MNELVRKQDIAVAIASDDGWDDAAAEASQRVIRGSLLKFADWKWTLGKEATPVAEGARLVALACTAGWVRWQGGKPVQYLMREPGKRLPDREDLGDNNAGAWELGPDEQPRDPWQFTRFVYLVNEKSAEQLTFSTSSWGGCDAVVMLADQIGRMRTAHPGAVPIIELHSAPMTTKFGRKSKPLFRVACWHGGAVGEPEPPKQLELADGQGRNERQNSVLISEEGNSPGRRQPPRHFPGRSACQIFHCAPMRKAASHSRQKLQFPLTPVQMEILAPRTRTRRTAGRFSHAIHQRKSR